MIPKTVAELVGVLMVATVGTMVARRLYIPYPALLAVIGIAGGFVLRGHIPSLGHNVILFVLLPGLLFDAALNLHWEQLRNNLTEVAVLATIGVALTTAVIAVLGASALGLSVAAAILFGAAVSATDPVAVVAVFRQLHVPGRLGNLIEAESLLNDGTGVVLFSVALTATSASAVAWPNYVGQFFLLTFGGLGLGTVLGWVASRWTARIDDPQLEITITAVLAYGGYLLGELAHVSGILCVVAAGVVVGNYGRPRTMSEPTQRAVTELWAYVAFVLNSVVFVLIGASAPWNTLLNHFGLVVAGAALALAARAITVYGLLSTLRGLGRPIPLRWQHLLVWGGLRGAVAVALALSLGVHGGEMAVVRALIFGVVLVSILVQGATIRPLTRALLPHLTRHQEPTNQPS